MAEKKGNHQMDSQITVRLPAKLVRLIDICSRRAKKNRTEYVREALIAKVEIDLQSGDE